MARTKDPAPKLSRPRVRGGRRYDPRADVLRQRGAALGALVDGFTTAPHRPRDPCVAVHAGWGNASERRLHFFPIPPGSSPTSSARASGTSRPKRPATRGPWSTSCGPGPRFVVKSSSAKARKDCAPCRSLITRTPKPPARETPTNPSTTTGCPPAFILSGFMKTRSAPVFSTWKSARSCATSTGTCSLTCGPPKDKN